MEVFKSYLLFISPVIGLVLLNSLLLKPFYGALPEIIQIKSADVIDLSRPLKLCLQKQKNKIASATIASDNDKSSSSEHVKPLFIGYQSGIIEKIDLATNFQSWVSDLGGEITTDLIFESNRLYVITKVLDNKDDTGNDEQIKYYILWSIDAETGITVWQFPFSSESLIHLTNTAYELLITSDNGTITAICKSDAQKIFVKRSARGFTSPPILFGNKIYISTADRSIVIMTADKGEIISKISTIQTPATDIITDGDKLIWGEKQGLVNLVRISDKLRLWSIRQGGAVSSLDLVPKGVLISSSDNFAYLYSFQKGKKLWKRRLPGRISSKPLIVGNFAVFTTSVDNSALVLDLRDGKIVNRISFDNKGFVLGTPQIIGNFLVFSTTEGIFTFANQYLECLTN